MSDIGPSGWTPGKPSSDLEVRLYRLLLGVLVEGDCGGEGGGDHKGHSNVGACDTSQVGEGDSGTPNSQTIFSSQLSHTVEPSASSTPNTTLLETSMNEPWWGLQLPVFRGG